MALRKIPHPEGPRSGRLEGRTDAPPTDRGSIHILSDRNTQRIEQRASRRPEPGAERDQARCDLLGVFGKIAGRRRAFRYALERVADLGLVPNARGLPN